MFPENREEKTIGYSLTDLWDLVSYLSMVTPIFSGVIVIMSGDLVNPIFSITLMIFLKGLPRYLCFGL